jgi:hypothetical protein
VDSDKEFTALPAGPRNGKVEVILDVSNVILKVPDVAKPKELDPI